jgi:hypothetical protein
MPIRQFKPVTAGTRGRSVSDFSEITRRTPEKSLTEPLKKSGGRDNHGHISMRRIGGGHKQKYRIIDFKRNKHGVAATVRHIEYDPNRSARIALVEYGDGEKRYILHPKGLAVGVLDERDARRAVRIVLDLAHRAGDAELVALEVDDAVLPLLAAATAAHRDVPVVVAAARLRQGLDQRLLGRGSCDLGKVSDGAEARSVRHRLELTNRHSVSPRRSRSNHPLRG